MPVEIDETQLANYRAAAGALAGLMSNPKSRELVLKAQQIVKPDTVIPELAEREARSAEIEGLRGEVGKLAGELKAERDARAEAERMSGLRSEWDKGRQKLRSSGYNDEGITKIEELMEQRGIADHEVAAAYFDRLNPPPAPVAAGGNRFDIFRPEARSDDTLKLLFEGKEEAFLNTAISQALGDVRGGR